MSKPTTTPRAQRATNAKIAIGGGYRRVRALAQRAVCAAVIASMVLSMVPTAAIAEAYADDASAAQPVALTSGASGASEVSGTSGDQSSTATSGESSGGESSAGAKAASTANGESTPAATSQPNDQGTPAGQTNDADATGTDAGTGATTSDKTGTGEGSGTDTSTNTNTDPADPSNSGEGGADEVDDAFAVVDVNGTKYSDIAAAWSAAQEAGTATVTLLADAEITQTLTVSDGMDITLVSDGGESGHSITSDTRDVLVLSVSGGSLTVKDGVKIMQNANMYATAVRVTGGEFTLAGGSVETNGCCLYVQGGSAKMTSGSIASGEDGYGVNVEGGSFALEGGDITGTYYGGIRLWRDGSVVISDGTVTGNDGDAIRYSGGSLRIEGGTVASIGQPSSYCAPLNISSPGETTDVKLSGGILKSTNSTGGARNDGLIQGSGTFTLRQLLADRCAYYSEGNEYSVKNPDGSGWVDLILHGWWSNCLGALDQEINGQYAQFLVSRDLVEILPCTYHTDYPGELTYTASDDGHTHSAECTACGTVLSEEHAWDGDTCTVCSAKRVATVTTSDDTSTSYSSIETAWAAAKADENSATVELLANTSLSEPLVVEDGDNITLTSSNNSEISLASGNSGVIEVNGGTLALDSGKITSSNYNVAGIWVSSGTLNMAGGEIASDGIGVLVGRGNAVVTIESGSISSLYTVGIQASGGSVTLAGGSISSASRDAISCRDDLADCSIGDLLADGYGIKDADDNWLTVADLDGTSLSSGAYTVEPAPIASLTVSPAPEDATVDFDYTADDAPTLTANATTAEDATGDVTYQWYQKNDKDGTYKAIENATDATYAFPENQPVGTYTYRVEATCDGYTVASEDVTVSVKARAVVTVTKEDGSGGTASEEFCYVTDAFASVGTGETATITLNEDAPVPDGENINVSGSVTLESAANSEGEDFAITGSYTSMDYIGLFTVSTGASLTIKGGKVKNQICSTNSTQRIIAICVRGGELNIDGGEISAIDENSDPYSDANYVFGIGVFSGSFNMKNGAVTGLQGKYYGEGIFCDGGDTSISGGSVTGGEMGLHETTGSRATIELEGGTFTSLVNATGNPAIRAEKSNISGILKKGYVLYAGKTAEGTPEYGVNATYANTGTGSYTVGVCTHVWPAKDEGNGTHTLGICKFCNSEDKNNTTEPHTWSAWESDGKGGYARACTASGCGAKEEAVASVTLADGTVDYHTDLDAARTVAQGAGTATVTLLSAVDLGAESLLVPADADITLAMSNDATLSGGGASVINVDGGTLTLKSGTVSSEIDGASAIEVASGALTLAGGTVSSTGQNAAAIGLIGGSLTMEDGTVTSKDGVGIDAGEGCNGVSINGGTVSGPTAVRLFGGTSTVGDATLTATSLGAALEIGGEANVNVTDGVFNGKCGVLLESTSTGNIALSGGSFTGESAPTQTDVAGKTVASLLADGYSFWDEDQELVDDDVSALAAGTVTVSPTVVATVTIGDTVTSYGHIAKAFASVGTGQTATITLVRDAKLPDGQNITVSGNVTFEGGEYTLSGSYSTPGSGLITVPKDAKLTVCNGAITNTFVGSYGVLAIYVDGGELIVEGGVVTASGSRSAASVYVSTGGAEIQDGEFNGAGYGLWVSGMWSATVTVRGGTFAGGSYGLYAGVSDDVNFAFSGGSFTGGTSAIRLIASLADATASVSDLLAPGYVYYEGETATDNPAYDMTSTDDELPAGTYTVGACTKHDYSDNTATDNGDGTHTATCIRCDAGEKTEDHVWGEWSVASAGSASRECTLCEATQDAEARVTVNDETSYFSTIEEAWAFAKAESSSDVPATVDLLEKTTIEKPLTVEEGNNIVLTSEREVNAAQEFCTIDAPAAGFDGTGVIVVSGGAFTMRGGGVCNWSVAEGSPSLLVTGGTVSVEGGQIVGGEPSGGGWYSMRVSGADAKVSLSGGYFNGIASDIPVDELLMDGYAYFVDRSVDFQVYTNSDGMHRFVRNGGFRVQAVPNDATIQRVAVSAQGESDVIGAEYGDRVSLEAAAEPVNDESVTYQWYECAYREGNTAIYNRSHTVITDATDATYTPDTSRVGTRYYFCVATAGDYSFMSNIVTVTVEPRELEVAFNGGPTGKTYDGTTDAPAGLELVIAKDGVVPDDDVKVTGDIAYDDANAGDAKTITASNIKLTGDDADKYTLPEGLTLTMSGSITKSTPELSFAKDADSTLGREYNGTELTVSDEQKTELLEVSGASLDDVELSWSNADGTKLEGNPVNAGTYTLTATIAETNNTKAARATLDVTISPKVVKVDNSSVTFDADSYEYTGEAIVPKTVTVYDGETVIPAGEYEVSYKDNVEIGEATVTIKDKNGGNYAVSGSATFKIVAGSLDVDDVKVTLDLPKEGYYTYDGSAHSPAVTVTKGGKELSPSEYTISHTNSRTGAVDITSAGTVTVTVTAKANGHYTGSNSTATFEIKPADLSNAEVDLTPTELTYTGEPQTKAIELRMFGQLKEDKDFTVEDNTATDAGTYTLTATGIGNYTGTITRKWEIARKELTVADFTPTKVYDGTNTVPTDELAKAQLSGVCKGDEDAVALDVSGVTATYNDMNAGDEKAVLFAGDFTLTGDAAKNYTLVQPTGITGTIERRDIDIKPNALSKEYGTDDPELTFDYTEKLPYELAEGDEWSGSLKRAAGEDVGAYEIGQGSLTILRDGVDVSSNYFLMFGVGVKFTITQSDLDTADVKVAGSYVYNGAAQEPDITVIKGGKTLKKGTDYTVSYKRGDEESKDLTSAGTVTVVVTAVDGGNYTGSNSTKTFTIAQKDIADETVSVALAENLTYTGKEQIQVVAVADSEAPVDERALVAGTDYELSKNRATNAGSYALTVTGVGNYTGMQTVGFSIAKAPLFVVGATVKGRTYEQGNRSVTVSGVTFKGAVANEQPARIATGLMADDAAGNGKDVQVTITVTDANYQLVSALDSAPIASNQTTITEKVDIAKANAPEVAEQSATYERTDPTSGKLNLAVLLPEDCGEVLYEVTGAPDGYAALENVDVSEAGLLTYSTLKADASVTDTITVRATMQNYEDATITLNVNLVDPLTISGAPTDSVTYGDEGFSLTAAGGIGDSAVTWESSDSGVLTVDAETGAVTVTGAGSATITATKPTGANGGEAATATVTLTVAPKPITVTAADAQKTYGDKDPGFTWNVSEGSLVGDDELDVAIAREKGEDAGTYTITASQETDANPNYAIDFVKGTFTIAPRVAELTWGATELTYNGEAQVPSVTVGNLVEGDTCDVAVEGTQTAAGSYTATVTPLSNGNYVLPRDGDESLSHAFAIAPKSVTVDITPGGGTYGGEIEPAAAKLDGVVAGEDVPVILTYAGTANDGTAYGPSADVPQLAGAYAVTASIDNPNYQLTGDATAAFTVARAAAGLTVVPGALDATYGDAGLALAASAASQADGASITYKSSDDSVAAVDASGNVVFTGTGTATITVSAPQTSNYEAGSVSVAVTVAKKGSKLELSKLAYEVTYGDGGFSVAPTAATEGDGSVTYTSSDGAVASVDASGHVTIAGAGTATITVAMAEGADYLAASAEVAVTVKPRPVTVTAADASKVYGDDDPEFAWSVTAGSLVGDDALTGISVSRESGEDAGEYAISLAGSDGANPNYSVTLVDGTFTVKPRDISGATIELGDALTADGSEQEQAVARVTVQTALGKELEVPLDQLEISGNKATDAGVYTLAVTAKNGGNFTGSASKTYVVMPAPSVPDEPTEPDTPVDPDEPDEPDEPGTPDEPDTPDTPDKPDTPAPITPNPDGGIDIGDGSIGVVVHHVGGAPDTELKTSEAAIISLLIADGGLTADELSLVAEGADLHVVLRVADANGTADDQARSLIEQKASGLTVGSYFDIGLFKRITKDGEAWPEVAINELSEPIEVSVRVPDSLLNRDSSVMRTFWIVREHEGAVDFLSCRFEASTLSLTFKTDRFSTYAIAYRDQAKGPGAGGSEGGSTTSPGITTPQATTKQPAADDPAKLNTATGDLPKTGDRSPATLTVIAMAGAALVAAGAALAIRRRRR